MVFKKMLGALGVGGPSVDTVLSNPNTRPGLPLTGQVNLTGGKNDVELAHITLGLVTRIEVDSPHGGDHSTVGEFHRTAVAGRTKLAAGQQLSIPFQVDMPWETPVTDVYGQRLHGMTMGLRTEVAIDRAIDKGDLDHVAVHPLPVQERILEAFSRLGFRFKGADLEYGRLHGVHQSLPFYQEIEFYPGPQYAHGISEVELTFVANPQTVEVVLEFDKRGGMFVGGHDAYGRYTVPHSHADTADWAQVVDGWVRQAVEARQTFFASRGGFAGMGGHGKSHGHGGHRGGGMGGMVAGAALGVAGGMIAGEMIEEAFEDDGGDFGDFGE
ncbi:sporulation protein [Asanoa ishikariensis]|uniref:Sporulation-control protein n=1 Tax=Asanoa ishikariensis TaxID=137265 RepID=A0A1H3TCE5_9ACTN|nr:sporulation protein [Asanoa ishikariensis]GIF62705.1 sporulation protein [Asanoa ishikariensis]SDZ47780.1 sporulation-control protein [Asanoa ishikariensis]